MKKKVGWFCTYTPVEILEAAGVEPYGIRLDSHQGHEDVYLGDSICSYARSCMGGALAGAYDFLDGVVIAHSCECMRRLHDGWLFKKAEIKPAMLHFLDVPRGKTERGIEFFTREIGRFKQAIEAAYGRISQEMLVDAIRKSSCTMALLAKVNEERKADNPPVSGTQIQELMIRGMTTPREIFNQELESLLAGMGTGQRHSGKPRIMVYGGPASTRLIEAIEEAGGLVVYEHMCNGMRQVRDPEEPGSDPIRHLAMSYLGKAPCPRMVGEHSIWGLSDIRNISREFRVDGIIFFSIKFCSNAQAGWPLFRDLLGRDVPVKQLEGDVSPDLNVREVQAFVKKLMRREKRYGTGTENS